VTVSAHSSTPPTPPATACATGTSISPRYSSPGTDTHRRWIAELDTIAAGLAELRDAGVSRALATVSRE
jgi:hypothetical protein